MKRLTLTLFVLLFCITSSYAQDSRFSIGGGLGFQFGSNTSGINVSPQVGYQVSKYLTTGVGIGYTYQKDKFSGYGTRYDWKTHYANANVFVRLYPIKYIVLSVQPEANYMWRSLKYREDGNHETYDNNKFVPTVLVGGGVRFGSVTGMIQYDVVQDKYTPYSNDLFYTVGYTFSL